MMNDRPSPAPMAADSLRSDGAPAMTPGAPSAARAGGWRPRLRLLARTLVSLLDGFVAVWGPVILVGKGLALWLHATFHPTPEWLSAIRRACIYVASVAGYWAYVRWYERRAATELR